MKRHLPFAALLVFVFATFCFAQEPTPSPTPKPKAPRVTKEMLQKDLAEKETALWNAFKNKDMKPFEEYLGADALVVDSSGVMSTSTLPEGMKMCDIKSFNLSDWKLSKPTTTTALLTYKGTQQGTCGGAPVPATVWASSLWVKRKDVWVTVFHQETAAR
jgi:hypothetical protein